VPLRDLSAESEYYAEPKLWNHPYTRMLYAEIGKTKEAYDLLLHAIALSGLDEPDSSIWYATRFWPWIISIAFLVAAGGIQMYN
jgi:hypothetical protein